MANIATVDYNDIPKRTAQMKMLGRELNTEFVTAYRSVEELHESWYGIRYNDLLKSFNNLIPAITEMLELVIGQVPFTLETIANNYAQADTGSRIVNAAQESINKIIDLKMQNDVGMRFVTIKVQEVQKSISNNFKNAKEKMNQIEAEYRKITWQSEAAEAFKARFQQLKSEITTSLDNIESDFTKLMNQTVDDIQRAEKANTVD